MVRVARQESELAVKENVVRAPPLALRWLAAALTAAAAALLLAAHLDASLPPAAPHDAAPTSFHGQRAHDHLRHLTAIGPRVAGSYENEVLAVNMLVAAIKEIAAAASPHVTVDLDLQRASGSFSLDFMDGLNHVYSNVQNVVVRVRAAGPAPRSPAPRPRAVLLNCHFDTVPDSPGASDDGAGCAVLLETLRAVSSARSPPRHDALFLFNGAEENVLQASHGFVTQHPWAAQARALINLEACGAGGREVLFQAGPGEPWIVEAYAGEVPRPFASSLAQEVFRSGLIPADTDYRVFRDFGNLSGVDLAWSADGYAYHTALDDAARVSPAVLQRTGDNVLALLRGLLRAPELDAGEADPGAGQPVFFDVLGLWAVSVRPVAAALLALGALALAALHVEREGRAARRRLLLPRGAWLRCVARGAGAALAAGAAGASTSAALGGALWALGRPLAWYSRPALLAPLYALPALAAAGLTGRLLARRWAWARGAGGWWAARAMAAGCSAVWGGALAACLLLRVRSGFVPALWAALGGAGGALGSGRSGAGRVACWALGAALPMVQTWYLAVPTLRMFASLAGRASTPPVPMDVALGTLTALLTLGACSWLLPLAVAARRAAPLLAALAAASALAAVMAVLSPLEAGYSPVTPHRIMAFHTRRTVHAPDAPPREELLYWLPLMDENAERACRLFGAPLEAARAPSPADCRAWPYCGAPYYLPVLRLLPRAMAAPSAQQPLARLRVTLERTRHNATHETVRVQATGEAHAVVALGVPPGARLAACGGGAAPRESARWGAEDAARSYFFLLHDALGAESAHHVLECTVEGSAGAAGGALAVAGHALARGPKGRAAEHAALLAALPAWTAPTGWGVDLHLYPL